MAHMFPEYGCRSAYKPTDYVKNVACKQSNRPRFPLPNYSITQCRCVVVGTASPGRYRVTDVHKLITFN
jgi:hypothetical protein